MKKSEIALIILIVSIVAFATYLIINTFVSKATAQSVEVEVVEVITSEVVEPDPAIFNEDAINPTVKVKIGDQSGQQPFTIGR